jgi:hypothetical protein
MRAERSRGSRIRSQSWRNELIEKDIRQKGPAMPGFFFFALALPEGCGFRILSRLVHLFGAIMPHLKHGILAKPLRYAVSIA